MQEEDVLNREVERLELALSVRQSEFDNHKLDLIKSRQQIARRLEDQIKDFAVSTSQLYLPLPKIRLLRQNRLSPNDLSHLTPEEKKDLEFALHFSHYETEKEMVKWDTCVTGTSGGGVVVMIFVADNPFLVRHFRVASVFDLDLIDVYLEPPNAHFSAWYPLSPPECSKLRQLVPQLSGTGFDQIHGISFITKLQSASNAIRQAQTDLEECRERQALFFAFSDDKRTRYGD